MELTEEIKTENVFDDEKQNDIFYSLLNGKTIKETIETSRGKFVVKFPKQKDLLAINRRVAIMRNGIPASQFDDIANFALEKIAYLDVCVESGEQWFNNLKKKNVNFSWEEMPDTNFIDEVYVKAWTFRKDVQAKFNANETKTNNAISDESNVSKNVGDGLFSGITNKNK